MADLISLLLIFIFSFIIFQKVINKEPNSRYISYMNDIVRFAIFITLVINALYIFGALTVDGYGLFMLISIFGNVGYAVYYMLKEKISMLNLVITAVCLLLIIIVL